MQKIYLRFKQKHIKNNIVPNQMFQALYFFEDSEYPYDTCNVFFVDNLTADVTPPMHCLITSKKNFDKDRKSCFNLILPKSDDVIAFLQGKNISFTEDYDTFIDNIQIEKVLDKERDCSILKDGAGFITGYSFECDSFIISGGENTVAIYCVMRELENIDKTYGNLRILRSATLGDKYALAQITKGEELAAPLRQKLAELEGVKDNGNEI